MSLETLTHLSVFVSIVLMILIVLSTCSKNLVRSNVKVLKRN